MAGGSFTQQFNAQASSKGDGVTDDTLTLKFALEQMPIGETMYFPQGTYKTQTGITLTPGKFVNFAAGASITASTAASGAINITSPGAYQILGRGTFTGGSGASGIMISSGAVSGSVYAEYASSSITNAGTITVNRPSVGRKRVPVFTRCQSNNPADGVVGIGPIGHTSDGTETIGTSRMQHYVTANCSNLTFVFQNGDGENLGAQSVTIKAALEDSAGNILPIFFNGARTVTAGVGALVESDPVGLSLNKGDQVWIRSAWGCSAAGTWPLVAFAAYSGEGYETGADHVDSGGSFTPFVFLANAMAVFGDVDVNTPHIGLIGDSITCGSGSARQGDSYPVIALGLNFGKNFCHANIGLGGDYAKYFIQPKYRYVRSRYLQGCTSVICEYGVNDAHFDGNAATLKANLITIWTMCAAQFGAQRVFQPTMLPSFATSTDSYATVANQTAGTNNATRVAVNNWIRDGSPIDITTHAAVAIGTTANTIRNGQTGHPLFAYFEAADIVESSRDSGKWKAPGYTSDGAHPLGTPLDAGPTTWLAAAIDTTLLV